MDERQVPSLEEIIDEFFGEFLPKLTGKENGVTEKENKDGKEILLEILKELKTQNRNLLALIARFDEEREEARKFREEIKKLLLKASR